MNIRKCFAMMLVGSMALSGAALADYEFDASVVCTRPEYVTAAIGGTVAETPVLAGQMLSSGDVIAQLKTDKIYATVDGDVTGVFGKPGDSVSAVTDRYGALMYIEPDSKYSITASTDYAYSASANKYIHVGESVYLLSSDGSYSGTGFVTSVDGTDFTVEVTGSFYVGNTVYVYRSESHTTKSRIGRGSIERAANVAVGGSSSSASNGAAGANGGSSDSASVVAVHVGEGDHVQAGDLLAETLSGEFDAFYCTGSTLESDKDGILASVNVSVGSPVSKGDVIATVYPRSAMQLKVDVTETDLAALPVGTPVEISFNWNEDSDDAEVLTGVVSQVLYTATSDAAGTEGMNGESTSSAASFAAYIDFEADEYTRIGMTAIVRPIVEGEAKAEVEEAVEVVEEAPDIPEMPEGGFPEMPEGGFPGMPEGEKP